jgi:hypothetical protein
LKVSREMFGIGICVLEGFYFISTQSYELVNVIGHIDDVRVNWNGISVN